MGFNYSTNIIIYDGQRVHEYHMYINADDYHRRIKTAMVILRESLEDRNLRDNCEIEMRLPS